MMYYVSANNEKTAKETVERLQTQNPSDCYITPLTAICLWSMELSNEVKTALRQDLMTVCDALIVASDVTDEMQSEIDLANLINMEVIRIE